jgi:hypothetical protein
VRPISLHRKPRTADSRTFASQTSKCAQRYTRLNARSRSLVRIRFLRTRCALSGSLASTRRLLAVLQERPESHGSKRRNRALRARRSAKSCDVRGFNGTFARLG